VIRGYLCGLSLGHTSVASGEVPYVLYYKLGGHSVGVTVRLKLPDARIRMFVVWARIHSQGTYGGIADAHCYKLIWSHSSCLLMSYKQSWKLKRLTKTNVGMMCAHRCACFNNSILREVQISSPNFGMALLLSRKEVACKLDCPKISFRKKEHLRSANLPL
jgi:hypothetical protein